MIEFASLKDPLQDNTAPAMKIKSCCSWKYDCAVTDVSEQYMFQA